MDLNLSEGHLCEMKHKESDLSSWVHTFKTINVTLKAFSFLSFSVCLSLSLSIKLYIHPYVDINDIVIDV